MCRVAEEREWVAHVLSPGVVGADPEIYKGGVHKITVGGAQNYCVPALTSF